MTKTELRPTPHTVLEGHYTIELWHEGKFIGTLVGADGPGIRIFSRRTFTTHDMKQTLERIAPIVEFDAHNVLEVRME